MSMGGQVGTTQQDPWNQPGWWSGPAPSGYSSGTRYTDNIPYVPIESNSPDGSYTNYAELPANSGMPVNNAPMPSSVSIGGASAGAPAQSYYAPQTAPNPLDPFGEGYGQPMPQQTPMPMPRPGPAMPMPAQPMPRPGPSLASMLNGPQHPFFSQNPYAALMMRNKFGR